MLRHIDYPLDEELVLNIMSDNEKDFDVYKDHRYTDWDKDWEMNWKILRIEHEYFTKIMEDLNIQADPRFYVLEPNTYLLPHVDNGTLCCVNMIIGAKSPEPINILGKDYSYTQALIDVSKEHSVRNGPEQRILLKFSIKNKTFEEVENEIQYLKVE